MALLVQDDTTSISQNDKLVKLLGTGFYPQE